MFFCDFRLLWSVYSQVGAHCARYKDMAKVPCRPNSRGMALKHLAASTPNSQLRVYK